MTMEAATRTADRLGGTLGTDGDGRRRLLFHHAPLALGSGIILLLFMVLSPFDTNNNPQGNIFGDTFPGARPQQAIGRDAAQVPQVGGTARFMRRSTVATGYVATGLLALTLLIGPGNLLLRRRNPVSSYLRRDVGTWTVIASVVHVVLGFQVHGDVDGSLSGFINYFVASDGTPLLNSFGLANWTGLVALAIVAALLALSTNGALRELKARTWKDLQRLNYTAFVLVILHLFFYGALLRLTSAFTILGIFMVIAVVAGQAAGIWLWRRRYARTGAALAQQAN